MKALVTGAAGFVLPHLVRRIVERNGEVVVVDRHFDEVIERFFASLKGVRYVLGDVRNAELWRTLELEQPFTHVVSGAAITPSATDEWKIGPAAITEVNVLGHCHAVELAVKHNSRLVYVSSNAVLGDNQSLYATTKRAAEAVTRSSREKAHVDASMVRLADVYGLLDRPTGARHRHNVPYYIRRERRLAVKKDVSRPPEDLYCFDLVDVDSVSRGLLASLLAPTVRTEYNLALGRPVPLLEIADAAGLPLQFSEADYNIEPLPAGHWLFSSPMDIEPAKTDLGWTPTPFKLALRTYLEDTSASE